VCSEHLIISVRFYLRGAGKKLAVLPQQAAEDRLKGYPDAMKSCQMSLKWSPKCRVSDQQFGKSWGAR
jgi:hypothetical protein